MELRRFLSLHILSVLFLLGFVYYATVFVFIEEWLGLQSSAGLLNSMIFTSLSFMSVFSFSICVLSDPGRTQSDYIPDFEHNQGADHETMKTGVHSKKCDKCLVRKPPRTHHCRVCGRCIMRMDHHCSWINNCVGFRNYKAFLLLVFYATVASSYSAIVILCSSLQKDWDSFGNHHSVKNFYVGCGLISVGLSFLLGSFLGWNIYLASRNMTTIEYYGASQAAWVARKSGLKHHHPYDVGTYKNIAQVLGPNMLNWLWPIAVGHIKDGLSFPTTHDSL